MVMKRSDILQILTQEVGIPKNSEEDLDLTDFIEDSIDLGEILAVIQDKSGQKISLAEFRHKRTLGEFISVLEKHIDVE